MSDTAAARGQPYKVCAVRFERLLPGPPERVWAHLTQAGKLAAWYGEDGHIAPSEGGAVSLMGGHIRGVVTQWRPSTRLAYTWNVFAPDDANAGQAVSPYPESYLTFDLTPEGGQVRLVLTHLPVQERFEAQNMMGWHTFLDMLGAALRGEAIEARPAYMQRNAAIYGVDLGALAR